MPASATRTTIALRNKARRIAQDRARIKRVSLGDAVSDLIEEAEANAPRARLEIRDGLPVLVGPPGTPAITSEMVKEALENEW